MLPRHRPLILAADDVLQMSPLDADRFFVLFWRREGDFTPEATFELVNTTYPLVFKREDNGKTFYCAINPSDRAYEIDVPANAKVIASNNATVNGNKAKLGGVSFLWMIAE